MIWAQEAERAVSSGLVNALASGKVGRLLEARALRWWSALGIRRPRPPTCVSGHLSRISEMGKGKKIPSSKRKPTEQIWGPFYLDLKEVEGVDMLTSHQP